LNSRVVIVLIGFVCLVGAVPSAVSLAAVKAGPTVNARASALISVDPTKAGGLARNVLQLAVGAASCAIKSGDIEMPPTLTVIDYSLPSTAPRLWVFDVPSGRLLFKELVAHGKGTGENMATSFSDAMSSQQSSLGLFVARDAYIGKNGYSLRLDGLEPGFNGNALDRAIVMHGAAYVDAAVAKKQGRIGRSWGCPALREAIAHDVIDTVRDGGVIFAYYPDDKWLTSSKFLNCPDRSSPAHVEAGQHADPGSILRRHDRDVDRHVQVAVSERHAAGNRER